MRVILVNKERSQVRATFDDTLKAQELLRVELDRLEDENTNISVTDRGTFFKKLGRATLGLEHDKECYIYLDDGSSLKIVRVGEFIRRLAYMKNPSRF